MQVFDKNMRRTGTLIYANDIQRRRRINSDYEVSFIVPMNTEDYLEKIQLKGHVRDERGQFYVINSRGRVREERKLTASIVCTHVMFKLTDFKFPYTSYIAEAYGVPITRLTDLITSATGGKFTFSVDDTFDLHDVKDFGRGNCMQALNDIVKMYECEVEPDNFKIHLRKKIGANNGLQYRLKKNIVSSSFKDDGASLVTRLFAQMKDGRTFIGLDASKLTEEERSLLSSAPGAIVNGKLAVNYLISPFAQYWSNTTNTYFDGEIIEQDIEDPLNLLEATRKALLKQEQPTLEVTISSADLFKIDNTEPRPYLGDTVTCIDPEMSLNKIKARITDLVEFPYALDKHSQPTISNVMIRDYDDIIADLERSKNIVDDMFSNGKIRTEVFETAAKQAITDINNSKTELIFPPEGGILAQEKGNPLFQVRLTAAGLGISTDGWKTIRSAVTARGVLAETVVGQFGNFVSMLIGSGNNVTQINTNGMAAGHSDFNSAPFRVDMQGNVTANKLTANYAQIKSSNFQDGQIIGSSINVGNGKFTVSSAGNVYTEGGIFSGGTITGALLRTAASGARVEVDSTGWKTYDTSNRKRISISSNDSQGMSAINWAGTGGQGLGYINGNDSVFTMLSTIPMLISSTNNNMSFNGYIDFSNAYNVTGLQISYISGLQAQLNSINSSLLSVPTTSQTATNMAFDPTTRNLKLFSVSGQTLATVNIPK
ncbi:phage tail spike protein [Paenibacillus dokdonensis]|uniref:Phage tail spike protein n=2 Tax=Paenibacillus dokdonensis TaxID=2567944 RepID=A0ABU6GQG6_9BACL|nr:phage tail spike protein [Paenibacillus dokdonensis]